MSYITYSPAILAEGKQLYVEHMRGQGYGGDDWDSLDESTRQLWAGRAADALEKSARAADRGKTHEAG